MVGDVSLDSVLCMWWPVFPVPFITEGICLSDGAQAAVLLA